MLVCPLCRLTLGDSETNCPRDGHEGIAARAEEVPAVVRARFSIVQAYAQGASGELYLADDQQTGRRGVLKMLRVPANVTPAEKARLKRELVKQATLGNPSLSVPLATGDANGVPWIFREWLEGVSLRVKLTRGGALAVPEALAIAAQMASALDELHRSGLLHRDLKPGHVILNPQPSGLPRVMVIDAGIAARIETGSVFDVMGTPEYVSPEQAKGKLVSFRSDLYALGCVLYEMLTGAPPFRGSATELLEAHANAPAPTPKVELPNNVSTLLSQLLAKEPRERPFSAQQVRRALEPFLPEDASSKREATQTFEKMASAPAGGAPVPPPPAGSGTLRPPRTGKSTVIGMPAHSASKPPPPPPSTRPKRADGTEELSALDLEQAEEVATKGAPAKTLLGLGMQAAPSPDSTNELTAMDLEDAEDEAATVAEASPLGAHSPTNGASTAPGFAAAHSSAAFAPTMAGGMPAVAPPWQQERITDHGAGLDYDDLAETMAVDRDAPPASAAPQHAAPATTAMPSPVAAAPMPAQPTPAPAVVSAKKKRSPILAIVGLLAIVGMCGVGIVGAGAVFWLGSRSVDVDEIASAPLFEPAPAPEPVYPPAPAPAVAPAPIPAPAPAPVIQPAPVVAQPAPAPAPEPVAVAQPEPAPAPAPEPVRAAEPARPAEQPRASHDRPREQPAQAAREPAEESGPSRVERFNAARERALTAFRAGQFAQAAAAYEEATELNPRHAGSYAGLGASRLAAGQPDRAIRAYQRAVALQPRHAGYLAALGQAYLASGDRTRARDAFSRALSIDPSNQTARQGMQRVGG